jgi:hypothetical protein
MTKQEHRAIRILLEEYFKAGEDRSFGVYKSNSYIVEDVVNYMVGGDERLYELKEVFDVAIEEWQKKHEEKFSFAASNFRYL